MASRFSIEAVFSAIDRMTGPVRRMQASTSALSRGLRTDFLAAQRRVEMSAGSMASRLDQFAAIGAGIGAAMIGREFLQFDHAILSASSKFNGLNIATAEGQQILERLKITAREVGAQTQFTASQAAQGLEFLAMAGFSAEQAMALLPGTVDLATAANIEMARATDIASDAIGAFGMMTSDTNQLARNFTRINDVMARTVTSTNTNLEDLFEAIKFGAPIFTAAGQSMETFNAIAGRMASNGIKGTNAGTALRMGMLRLVSPPAEAAAALARLNVRTTDASGNMRNMIDILGDMETATAGMTNQQRLAAISQIFGVRAASAFAGILTEGVSQTRALAGVLNNASGAAAQMAGVVRTSLINRLKILWSAIVEVGFKFIEMMMPFVEIFVKLAPIILSSVGAFYLYRKALLAVAFAQMMMGKTAGLTPMGRLVIIIGALIGLIMYLRANWDSYSQTTKDWIIIVGTIAGIVLGIVAALKAWAAIQVVLNVLMMANPIGLVIAAIAIIIGLIYLLIRNWDTVTAAFIRAGAVVWDTMKTIGQAIMRFMLAPINLIITGILWILDLAARLTGSDMLASAANSIRSFQSGMNSPFQSETGPGVITNREAAARGGGSGEVRVVIDNQSGGAARSGGRVIPNGSSQQFSSPVWGS